MTEQEYAQVCDYLRSILLPDGIAATAIVLVEWTTPTRSCSPSFFTGKGNSGGRNSHCPFVAVSRCMTILGSAPAALARPAQLTIPANLAGYFPGARRALATNCPPSFLAFGGPYELRLFRASA
jgi:hypothetical protein